ncbi:MAG: BREX-1 system phosphatase PglZ type A, partial [Chloroflexi bacterium]|nr:BREX-1 system phosphatase PglZ type A [Chloroflexota bacterium]
CGNFPMDTRQVNDALDKLFQEERIVFWNDPDKEFLAYMDEQLFSPIEGVKVLRLDQTGALAAKLLIERKEANGRFLIYAPEEEPDYENDWLLDIRLYSRSFRADRASILLEELGLTTQHLREHLAQRRKFFDNKERLQKLKSLVSPEDTADDLDRKMLAVVVKADQPELFNILRTLFHLYAELEDLDLREPVQAWEQIVKFDLEEPFWRQVKKSFGYFEEIASLENLLIRLLVTDFAQHLRGELPASLEQLILPPAGRANAVVCLAQWRDSASTGGSYDRLSEYVADVVNLSDHLHPFDIDDLMDVQTFLDVEKEIARNLKARVMATADTINLDEVREIATRRQAGHWALSMASGSSSVPRKELHAVYEALVAAAEFFDLRNSHRHGFEFDDAPAMYKAYGNELYRFDQLYRHFCEFADRSQNWNVVKDLRDEIEASYSNWYIPTLGLAWGKFVESGLLNKWNIPGVPNEYEFYRQHVHTRLQESENRKAYVIISDAFRYEAAQELAQELNGKYRFQASLSSQLSVVPSYTALGMASLLPHETLGYDKKGNVLLDGKPCASSEQRNDILSTVEGMVVRADDLLSMKKEEGRDLVAGKKVVYIYHDEIDSRGEKASTEGDTFDAVRKAIDELADLVRFVVDSLNGNYVVITADHGFLFSDTAPTEPHKSRLEDKPDGTVIAKKRFLLGHNLPDVDEAYHGHTKVTARAEGEMEFWVPKSANRFHFAGGARFIHGGTMLQEITVPVITVRHIKGKTKNETATRRVGVQVLGVNHRITTPKHRFQLLQSEPVSERVKEVTLKVAIYEGSEPVTNIEKVTFDSTSDNMEERTKPVMLVLQDRHYDKKSDYRLVLRDAETDIEQSRVDLIIDRAFSDDF